jgi:hypothetical protein
MDGTMPKWKCPMYGCDVWVYAPSKQPVHATAPNPYFQAKDPHCPGHGCDLVWTADPVETQQETPVLTSTATTSVLDQKNGIQVATYNGSIPIYCDYHQRKHISGGAWPGNTPVDSPLFLSSVFSRSRLALCTLLATTIPWGRVPKIGGVDAIFNCGTTTVGTKGETDILVQGGWSGNVITFHAYPIKEEGTQAVAFKRARSDGWYFTITVPA